MDKFCPFSSIRERMPMFANHDVHITVAGLSPYCPMTADGSLLPSQLKLPGDMGTEGSCGYRRSKCVCPTSCCYVIVSPTVDDSQRNRFSTKKQVDLNPPALSVIAATAPCHNQNGLEHYHKRRERSGRWINGLLWAGCQEEHYWRLENRTIHLR